MVLALCEIDGIVVIKNKNLWMRKVCQNLSYKYKKTLLKEGLILTLFNSQKIIVFQV